MLNRKRRLGIGMMLAVMLAGMLPLPVVASLNSCMARIEPASVQPGSSVVFDVRLTNTGGPTIHWIQIARPNDNYLVDTAGLEGWDASIDEGGMVLTGGSLAINEEFHFQLAVRTGLYKNGAAAWVVRASDDNGGLAATSCTGDLATTIAGRLPSEAEGQRISGVTVDVKDNVATVRWYSEVPTGSVVFYGETADYDRASAYDSQFTTVHKVVLGGLKPATSYHFQVAGLDEGKNPSYSGDNTFLTTAALPSTENGGTGTGTVARGVTPRGTVALNATPAETIAPVVAMSTSVAKPFTAMPVLAGTATDNVAVARVDYSLDGGKTWILVANPPGLGTKTARFTIAPNKLEDGNYELVVRGTDTSGNVGTARPGTLVVDLAPPRVGSELVAYGSQLAVLDDAGRYRAAVGADQMVTLNAVGGPTSMVVEAVPSGQDWSVKGLQRFYLRQNRESGLWSGALGFAKAGTYHLRVVARDGAGNETMRGLRDVTVSNPARVMNAQGEGVAGATVTLFQRDADTGQWKEWDGEAYGQVNPQHARGEGVFGALVPAGTYYLKVAADGYQPLVTQTFTFDRTMPLVPTVRLALAPKLTVGKWSWAWPGVMFLRVAVDPLAGTQGASGTGEGTEAVLGKLLPKFNLPTTDGRVITSVGLQGHPAVVTVLSTWSPVTNGQLGALAAVPARAKAAVVMPLYVGEHVGRVQSTLARAGYTLPAVVDIHAVWGEGLGVPTVPTHYFVDQTGKVRSVYAGVLSTTEILERLAKL